MNWPNFQHTTRKVSVFHIINAILWRVQKDFRLTLCGLMETLLPMTNKNDFSFFHGIWNMVRKHELLIKLCILYSDSLIAVYLVDSSLSHFVSLIPLNDGPYTSDVFLWRPFGIVFLLMFKPYDQSYNRRVFHSTNISTRFYPITKTFKRQCSIKSNQLTSERP